MMTMIKVGIADYNICKAPDAITTLGLGSCVGICLYDPVTKIGGLSHIMLPDSTQMTRDMNPAKYADTGIDLLVKDLIKAGALRVRLKAKIAGGAQMFAFSNTSSSGVGRVGDRNVEAVKAKLAALHIPILAEDTGANYGRTIEFYPEDGRLRIKAVGKSIKEM